jgi:hypothetical protein
MKRWLLCGLYLHPDKGHFSHMGLHGGRQMGAQSVPAA